MPNTYTVGSLVRVTGTFKDINNALADPSTVTFKYKNPVTLVTTTLTYPATVVKDSTGVYHYDIDTGTSAGDWWVRWESTGTAQGAVESVFRASPTRV